MNREEVVQSCTRCKGSGFLFDMMLNEKPCYICKGEKVIRHFLLSKGDVKNEGN